MKINYKLLFYLIIPFFLACDSEDENVNESNDTVIIAERIEFSKSNNIPENLKLLSLEGFTDVDQDTPIPIPNSGNGLEFLKDSNNKLLFVKKNIPNFDNSKINSESTVLYFTTLNTLYEGSTLAQKSNFINQILNNPLYQEAVNILNAQLNIDLFSNQFINVINNLINDIFLTENIEPNSLQLGSVNYNINSTNITINNPTNNHIGLGIYLNGLSQGVQVLDPSESIDFELEQVNSNYDFNLMSGEDVATDIFGNNELEEIEAFDADMREFLESSCYALLGFLPESCFSEIFNTIYGNVNFALEYEQSESTLGAVIQALDLFFIQSSGALGSAEECTNTINFDSLSEITEYIGQIFEAIEAGGFLAEISVTIQDYNIYENQFELCLETDGNGVFVCDVDSVEPAMNPNPSNSAIDVPNNGTLSFDEGQNTPTNATFRLFFDDNPNPTTHYDLGMDTLFNYTQLENNQTYYWKIETVSNTDDVLATSQIWSFTTSTSTANTEPVFNPIPSDNTTDIVLNGNLAFTEGANTPANATYRLYFDTNIVPTTQFDIGNQTSYNYSNLQHSTVYYWYVETLNNLGDVLATSTIWSFTTQNNNSGGVHEGSVILTNQIEVDSFGANNYSSINGTLRIEGGNISSLNSLSSLIEIKSSLIIQNTPNLSQLTGLNNIESIGPDGVGGNQSGGHLWIENTGLININELESINTIWTDVRFIDNPNLTNIELLSNLSFIGRILVVRNNDSLSNLEGLRNITSVGEDIRIDNNTNILTLYGLRNINSVSGAIQIFNNDSIQDLAGLESLITMEILIIGLNDNLTSLTGLENLTHVNNHVLIGANVALSDFCSLSNLLINGSITNGIDIYDNLYNPTEQDIINGNCSQ